MIFFGFTVVLLVLWFFPNAITGVDATTGTLTVRGTTTLAEDHTGNIVIVADNAKLDCAGHSISGPGSGIGISLFRVTGVQVMNCHVTNFGVAFELRHASTNILQGNTATDNGVNGFRLGILSSDNTLIDNAACGNGLDVSQVDTSIGNRFMDNSFCQVSGQLKADDVEFTLRCPDCQTLTVERIINGDTFEGPDERVRLFGVDTPEHGESCFAEATQRLRQLAGGIVRVEPGPRAVDGFGSLLYYTYTLDGDSIDAALIAEGLGEAWTRDGQHRDYLVGLEDEARVGGVGCLW